MNIKLSFPKLNPFASSFSRSRPKKEIEIEKQRTANAQGITQADIIQQNAYNAPYVIADGQVIVTAMQFEQTFESKRQKVQKYREMSYFPPIKEATEHVCDDSILPDADGRVVHLDILEEIPENWHKKILQEWDYVVNDVLNFKETGWDSFNRWLIDAEIFAELILNDEKDSIIGVNLLPPYTVMPVYFSGDIVGYVQVPEKAALNWRPEKDQVDFDRDQIVYVDYFDRGIDITDVRGYYESAIKPYNQLKSMEDALVVARISRAPLRRSWNIDVGRMTKPNAESYIKGLIQRFRKRLYYDPNTGAVNSSENHIALTEDYWFARTADGKGTSMEHVDPGIAGLGELDDVQFFRNNLYMSLKMPRSRYDPEAIYHTGRSGEITREEIKFSRFIDRLQNRFGYYILDPFITQLRLRGIPDEYARYDLFNVWFTESNLFKEYKEIELLDARLSTLATISPYIYSSENPEGLFDPEFVLKNYFRMPHHEFEENQRMLRARKLADRLAGGTSEAGGGGFEGGGAEIGGGAPSGEGGISPEAEEGGEVPEEGGEVPEEGGGAEGTPEEILAASKDYPNLVYPKEKKMDFSFYQSWRREDAELLKRKKQSAPVLNEEKFAILCEMSTYTSTRGEPGGEDEIMQDLREIGVDDFRKKLYKMNPDSDTTIEYAVVTGIYDAPRYLLDQLIKKGYKIDKEILRGIEYDWLVLEKDGHFYEVEVNQKPMKQAEFDEKPDKWRDQPHITVSTITQRWDREEGRGKGGFQPKDYKYQEAL